MTFPSVLCHLMVAGPCSMCAYLFGCNKNILALLHYLNFTMESFRAAVGFKLCSWATTVIVGFSISPWKTLCEDIAGLHSAFSCSSDRLILLDA